MMACGCSRKSVRPLDSAKPSGLEGRPSTDTSIHRASTAKKPRNRKGKAPRELPLSVKITRICLEPLSSHPLSEPWQELESVLSFDLAAALLVKEVRLGDSLRRERRHRFRREGKVAPEEDSRRID